jgi:hypothetical protein
MIVGEHLYIDDLAGFNAIASTGDHNQDGAVDYVVWRDRLSSTYTQTDCDVWQAHFGKSVGNGAALPSAQPLSAAVPEPTSTAMVLTGLAPMTLNIAREQRSRALSR